MPILQAAAMSIKKKFDDKVTELETANNTITGLRETVTKFDGVDVERLKADAKEWEAKYNTDIEAVKLDSAVDLGIVAAKAKNPKLIKAALDMSLIKRDGENVIGLSEQLDNLKKSDGYLFEEEQQQDNGGARCKHRRGAYGKYKYRHIYERSDEGRGLRNERKGVITNG